MKHPADTIEMLARIRRGDPGAYDELLPHVYAELRSLGRLYLRRERPGHTLQATALVHEAFLRLAGAGALAWQDRAHFVAVAARAMRRVLVEHARARRRKKRGGDRRYEQRLSLSAIAGPPSADPIDLLALDAALERLSRNDPRKTRVVELLYFGGLAAAEAAHVLGVTPRTIERDWAYARAWLLRELQAGASRLTSSSPRRKRCPPRNGSSSGR